MTKGRGTFRGFRKGMNLGTSGNVKVGAAATPVITFITSNDNSVYGAKTTIATDTTIHTEVGDLVVIAVRYYATGTVTAVDNATTPNTFTMTAEVGISDGYTRIGYCVITTASETATITATIPASSERDDIFALQFRKDTGTWVYEGVVSGTTASGTTIASGNINTTYAAGLSVAMAASSSGTAAFTLTNINNGAGTLAPASPEEPNKARTFYLLHSELTGNHSDVSKASAANLTTQLVVFGVAP